MRIRGRLCRLWSEASFAVRLTQLICALTPAMGMTTFTIVMVTTLLMRCSVATRTLAAAYGMGGPIRATIHRVLRIRHGLSPLQRAPSAIVGARVFDTPRLATR